MKIATWNVNGIRARQAQFQEWVEQGCFDEAENERAGRKRASFNWQSVSFGEALRDICREWDLNVSQHLDRGFGLSFRHGRYPPDPVLATGSGSGWRVEVHKARFAPRLAAPDFQRIDGISLNLEMTVRCLGFDADRVTGVGQLRAAEAGRTLFELEPTGPVPNLAYGTSYGPDGSLIGLTILSARRRFAREGKISFTLPEQRVEVTDLGNALG